MPTATSEIKKDPTDLNLATADSLWTTAKDGAVKLRMAELGPGSEPPMTTVQMFQKSVQNFGHRPALALNRNGQWEFTSYLQYYEQCRAAAKSFLKLGLERFHSIGILGINSPEWFIADIGAIMAGGFAVGIHTLFSSDTQQYVASRCETQILVVDNHQNLQRILQDQLPHVRAIIQYHDEQKVNRPNVYTWKEFMQLGADIPDSRLDGIITSLKANQCCAIIYTSATTGLPNGVMLSHDNVTWTVKAFGNYVGLQDSEIFASNGHLCHVSARYDIWLSMCFGGTTYFASTDALKGSKIEVLKQIRPTLFFAVPRIWDSIHEKAVSIESELSLKRSIITNQTKTPEMAANGNHVNGDDGLSWDYSFAETPIHKEIKAGLGLDRCVWCHAGTAPMKEDTKKFFMRLNIPLMERYGMTETFGPHMVSVKDNFRLSSCGKTIPGCKTRIYRPDEDGIGETCFWGRNIFMGYLNMAAITKKVFDEDGWLHTGDLGKLDHDGFMYLTGRIKELVITSGGSKIPPAPVENAVKKELPIISNAMLVGDQRDFPSMLLTLKCTVDGDTEEPQDDLTPEAIQFCQQLGSSATRVSEVVRSKDPAIYKAIEKGMQRVNEKALATFHQVHKWTILTKDFSVTGGELGPSFKLRRSVVKNMYAQLIDELYQA
ncbi:long-chain-fatty-acid--CoA ligase ACSBG2-like isoform X2 [Ambystoma mexicanum]|uniref:long-chain-fatty-acid--CoA ligase ACSBG2-like isoform X2 n=1 Tax=Ambystoma mexicanum TaxID=8296 RepID=UPI0037E788CC